MKYFLLTILIFGPNGIPQNIGTHKKPIHSLERCEQQGRRVVDDLATLKPPIKAKFVCFQEGSTIKHFFSIKPS